MDFASIADYLAENRGRLLPILMLTMIGMSLSMFSITSILPHWTTHQEISTALEAAQSALESKIEQESADNISVLTAQLESVEEKIATAAGIILTNEEAEGLFSQLYIYASESRVDIVSLIVQQQDAQKLTAYEPHTLRLQVEGSVVRLTNFVMRIREANIASVEIANLVIGAEENSAILNMDIQFYASEFATGTAFDDLGEALPPIPDNYQDIVPSLGISKNPVPVLAVDSQETVQSNGTVVSGTNTGAQTIVAQRAVGDLAMILNNLRSDLESFATQQLGGTRPIGWSGETNLSNPEFVMLLRLDLEFLAGDLLGSDVRPGGWMGPVAGTTMSIAFDVRKDLELLVKTINLGQPIAGWIGASPLASCSRLTVMLVEYLISNTNYSLNVDPTVSDFCLAVENDTTRYLGDHPDIARPGEEKPQEPVQSIITHFVQGDFSLLFSDRSGSGKLGLIPKLTPFVPVARSYAEYSNMMLVRGEGFEGLVEYPFTSINRQEFQQLPNIDDFTISPYCTAYWCS